MYAKLVAAAAITALSAAAAWQAQTWRYTAQIESIHSAYSKANAEANEVAMTLTTELQRRKDDAIAKAEERARKNESLATTARADAHSLREQLALARVQVPGATCTSVRDHAATLSELLGECIGAYQGMAEKATGHAADSRTLIEAWPVHKD